MSVHALDPLEQAAHYWLGRLAMCLAIASHDLPGPVQAHARKTLDEFLDSDAASQPLTDSVRGEVSR